MVEVPLQAVQGLAVTGGLHFSVGGSWWWTRVGGDPSSERGPYDTSPEAGAIAAGFDSAPGEGTSRNPRSAPKIILYYFRRDDQMRATAKWLCYASLPPGFIVPAGASRALALEKVKRQIEWLFPDAEFPSRYFAAGENRTARVSRE